MHERRTIAIDDSGRLSVLSISMSVYLPRDFAVHIRVNGSRSC